MSTVQDIMRELQAGEEAKALIPDLHRRIALLEGEINKTLQHNQALELRARDREETITSLNQRVSSLVVERDDASFRELEAKDHFDTLLESVRPIWSSLGHALNRADPPKPVPVAEPVKVEAPNPEGHMERMAKMELGQSDPRPPSAGIAEAASGPVPATEPAAVSAPQPGSHNTGIAGPDPWNPKVEMPSFKPEDPAPAENPYKDLPF